MNVAVGNPFLYDHAGASLHIGLRIQGGYVALCNDLDEDDERCGGWGTWSAERTIEDAVRRLQYHVNRDVCQTCLTRIQDMRDPITRLAEVAMYKTGDVVIRARLGKRGVVVGRYLDSSHLYNVRFDCTPDQCLVVHESDLEPADAIDQLSNLMQHHERSASRVASPARVPRVGSSPTFSPQPTRGTHLQGSADLA